MNERIPADHGEPPARDTPADGGTRTRAGSNYGDYTPPVERAPGHAPLPDVPLPPEVAPDDPDAALVKARLLQRQARERGTPPG